MLLLAVLATAGAVSAFGNFAHRLIAKLVWERLEPATRTGIRSLIGDQSFNSLACWADEVKHQPEYTWTQHLHFADMPDDPPMYCAVDFTADDNVVAAAINFTRRARNSKEDLAFMVPVNPVVTAKENGGNRIKLLDTSGEKKRRVTLHYVLDSFIFHVFPVVATHLQRIVHLSHQGSYSRFFQLLRSRRTKHRPCLPVHCLESCVWKWTRYSSMLNCRHFWHLPADNLVDSYAMMHHEAVIKLLLFTADRVAETLHHVFA